MPSLRVKSISVLPLLMLCRAARGAQDETAAMTRTNASTGAFTDRAFIHAA